MPGHYATWILPVPYQSIFRQVINKSSETLDACMRMRFKNANLNFWKQIVLSLPKEFMQIKSKPIGLGFHSLRLLCVHEFHKIFSQFISFREHVL
jgi:lantibiotic modifying enzyme